MAGDLVVTQIGAEMVLVRLYTAAEADADTEQTILLNRLRRETRYRDPAFVATCILGIMGDDWSYDEEVVMGGKPSKGTKKDKRLKGNRPG